MDDKFAFAIVDIRFINFDLLNIGLNFIREETCKTATSLRFTYIVRFNGMSEGHWFLAALTAFQRFTLGPMHNRVTLLAFLAKKFESIFSFKIRILDQSCDRNGRDRNPKI